MKLKKVLQLADKPTLDKILDYARRIDAGIFDAQSLDWGAYFSSRATGEVFSTKFYKQSVSNTVIGERLNASVGKTCQPSTDTVKGQDDFASYNAFWFTDCNFIVNDAGVKIPTYIDGQGGFSRTGKVDVGVLTPPLYYGIEQVSDGEIWHLSDSPHPELGLVLMPHCRDAKGNPMPYGIVTKYYAGLIDEVPYSSSGLRLWNFVSYQNLHSAMQKKGVGYNGSGSERSAYLITMLRIKYATSSSQKIFAGYTNYSYQYKVAQASTGNYVVLTKAQAANCLVGSVVSIGDPAANTNLDRGYGYMNNLANMAKITKVEVIDANYSKVYLDAPSMTVTATSYISSMPLYSGQTDSVLGNDGSMGSNTDGRHSYKIQGVEDGIGSYYVSANEVMYKETADKTIFYVRAGADYSTDLATIQSTWKKVGEFTSPNSADIWIGELYIDPETGATMIRTIGTGNVSGTGDRYYFGGTGTGLREKLERGYLGNGSDAGLSCLGGWNGLGGAWWYCAGCV